MSGLAVEDSAPPPGVRRRIVLATWGSYGDLHPYIALARALQVRGHQVVLATTNNYRAKIESQGILFHAVHPDFPDLDADPALGRRVMEPIKGTEVILRELVLRRLLETPRVTEQAARVGAEVRSEDGARTAADAIEALLRSRR